MVEPSPISSSGLEAKTGSMRQAIGLFFNVLVLVILLKIFAPGLADQLIELLGKLLALANQLLDAAIQQSQQQQAVSLLSLV